MVYKVLSICFEKQSTEADVRVIEAASQAHPTLGPLGAASELDQIMLCHAYVYCNQARAARHREKML